MAEWRLRWLKRLPHLLAVVAGLVAVITVLGLAIWVLPPTLIQAHLDKNAKITDADRLKAINDVRGALLTAAGVLAVFSGSLVAYLNFRGTLELNRRGQVTDRFGKAIDQLGKGDQLDVRIGGIYALEQIARDAEDLHWPVMEVLTAFVREHAKSAAGAQPGGKESDQDQAVMSEPKPAADIQAALTVLGRRASSRGVGRLDLSGANLQGANLGGANLQGAAIGGVNLQGAFLARANLQGAVLWNATLQGANLGRANLQGANLLWANLENADLESATLKDALLNSANLEGVVLAGANLQGALLTMANLQGAILSGATLGGAHLGGANLRYTILEGGEEPAPFAGDWGPAQGLTWEQLREAEGVDEASLPLYLRPAAVADPPGSRERGARE